MWLYGFWLMIGWKGSGIGGRLLGLSLLLFPPLLHRAVWKLDSTAGVQAAISGYETMC